MQYTIGTRNSPCTVAVVIKALKQFTLRIQASDDQRENTFLSNRFSDIKEGEETVFYIQMPLSPNVCRITLFDDVLGETSKDREPSFQVKRIYKTRLKHRHPLALLNDPKTKEFVRFAQRFCYNAGWIRANLDDETYSSDNNEFRIKYLPIICDGGVEVTTPARINKYTKIIEVSKRKYIGMTVPERICILLHEYAHLFINANEADELEADLNGLCIYLSLGYPRIEAYEVFIKTFYTVPTPQNLERYKHIEEFIDQFDQQKVS